MTVQIMLTVESLLPACEWTAMHEKKGLNDSYVFSVHGILPSLLSLTLGPCIKQQQQSTALICLL